MGDEFSNFFKNGGISDFSHKSAGVGKIGGVVKYFHTN